MEATKKCPFCGERINVEAIKCRYCKEFLEDNRGLPVSNHAKKRLPPRREEPEEKESDIPESIVAVPSLWSIAGTFFSGAIFFALGMVLLLWPVAQLLQKIPNFPQNQKTLTEQSIRFAGLGVMFIVILVVAYKIAYLKSIHYEISTDRIEWRRGLFSRQIDNLDMFRVVDIQLHRSFKDRILGIGKLRLITKGDKTESDKKKFMAEKISRPRQVYDFIKAASLKADRRQNVIHIE